MYTEAVTGGYYRVADSFDAFWAAAKERPNGLPPIWGAGDLDYFRWLARVGAILNPEDFRVRVFEEAPKGDALFSDFLSACGVACSAIEWPTDRRATNGAFGSRQDVEVIRLMNRLQYRDDESYRNFLGMYAQRVADTGHAATVYLRREDREVTLDRYAASNAAVAESFLGKRGKQLFDLEIDPKQDVSSIPAGLLDSAFDLYNQVEGKAPNSD